MSGSRPRRSGPPCERKIDERLTTLIAAVYPDDQRRPGCTKPAQETREIPCRRGASRFRPALSGRVVPR
ncbi:hypothetical protein [Streptomyces gobitricini]